LLDNFIPYATILLVQFAYEGKIPRKAEEHSDNRIGVLPPVVFPSTGSNFHLFVATHAAVQVNPVQVGLGQVGLGQIGPFFWPVNALSDRDLTGLTGQGRG
jgi:hypothetical protein